MVDKSSYKSIKPVGSRPGIFYGLEIKIYKETRNGLPSFRPILSAIGNLTCQQDSNLHMAILDVDSLFTNIPLDETTDIYIDNLYNGNENPPKLPFLGSTSFQIRKKLQKWFNDKLTCCNLKIVFTSPVRVKSFSTFKDKLPKMLLSGLVYK